MDELLGLYQSSEALLVTSKRDGMNLVTLEYIAAQNAKHPGVVLLSEFTGAASLIGRTLVMNPWDSDDVAVKMKKAIDMPLKERVERWKEMNSFLVDYTGTTWAASFMGQLESTIAADKEATSKFSVTAPRVKKLLRSGGLLSRGNNSNKKIVIFVDYDGSLVPIEELPDSAHLPADKLRLLKKINSHPRIQLVVISGRPSTFLENQLGSKDFVLAAEHGAKVLDLKKGRWRSRVNNRRSDWFSVAKSIMTDYSKRVQGSFVESKSYSVAWHYRQSPGAYASYQARKLYEELESGLANAPVSIISGKKVIEIRSMEANKGFFCSTFLGRRDNVFPVAVGDDRTDEDMFQVVVENGWAFKVGEGNTHAQFCLAEQGDVFPLLETLYEQLSTS
jgi:trehalose 6-phosphate synthase/phosphatase